MPHCSEELRRRRKSNGHNRLADAALQKFVESIFMPEAEFRNDII